MTQPEDTARTIERKGLDVNGQPTTLHLFSTDQLRQSIFLPSLLKVINVAFAKAHASQPQLKMHTGDRLGSTEELLDNLTHDPEAFIVIISRPGDSEVMGTASCRRYHGPMKDSKSPWMRRLPVEEGSVEWELKMMATDPIAQGQGLAGVMMKTAEEEIIRRTRLQVSKLPIGTVKQIKLVLCTPREINGAFYARRGYQWEYEVERGEGYDFHIVFMSKIIHKFD